MEHPPKQGLKHLPIHHRIMVAMVLMEHPPKQGLKHSQYRKLRFRKTRFNGTSTKTRIETKAPQTTAGHSKVSFNGTSTKTRIETS